MVQLVKKMHFMTLRRVFEWFLIDFGHVFFSTIFDHFGHSYATFALFWRHFLAPRGRRGAGEGAEGALMRRRRMSATFAVHKLRKYRQVGTLKRAQHYSNTGKCALHFPH